MLGISVYTIAYYYRLVNLQVANSGKFAPLSHSADYGYSGSMNTPNQLSREAIEEFKAIYQEEFGEELADDEVQEIAMRLLRFFGILTQVQ